MGNFKVVQYLKRSLSGKEAREQQFVGLNMSLRLPAEKVTSSISASDPTNYSSNVIRDESEIDGPDQVYHNSITSQIDDEYLASEEHSACSVSIVEENSASIPPQHKCKKDSNWNQVEALKMKTCSPTLAIATRRQGRQDICIRDSGTYEYVENSLSSKLFPYVTEKRTLHRHGLGPLALNRSQLLNLKNLDRDTFLARPKNKNDNLTTTKCLLSSIDRPCYEATQSAENELENPHGDFGLDYNDGLGHSHVIQNSTGCFPRYSVVPSEAAEGEFGWIPILYAASGDTEEANEEDCNPGTARGSTPSYRQDY